MGVRNTKEEKIYLFYPAHPRHSQTSRGLGLCGRATEAQSSVPPQAVSSPGLPLDSLLQGQQDPRVKMLSQGGHTDLARIEAKPREGPAPAIK